MKHIIINHFFVIWSIFSGIVLAGCSNTDKSNVFESVVRESTININASKSFPFEYGHFLSAEYGNKTATFNISVDEPYAGLINLDTQCDSRFSALNIMTPIVEALSQRFSLDEISDMVEKSGIKYQYSYHNQTGNKIREVIISNKQLVETIPYIYAATEDSYFPLDFYAKYFAESMSLFVPLRLDEYTLLREVIATEAGPQYIYEVSGIPKENFTKVAIDEIRQSIILELKNSTKWQPFFKEMSKTPLVIKHKYIDPESGELFTFEIKPIEIVSNV